MELARISHRMTAEARDRRAITSEAVQGMEVITHNYKAEYGRNSGSIVSLVSRSGSNDFHGSGYWYHINSATRARNFFEVDHINSATRARNFFEVDKAKSRVNLPGLTLGGPIKRNKAFFFGNFPMPSISTSQSKGSCGTRVRP